MPSFDWSRGVWFYALWAAVAFGATIIFNSFAEWLIHRFVLHQRRALLSYPYEKHDRQHHIIFGAGETYHAKDDFMRGHITFTALDYVLILLANVPLWIGVELLTGRPWILGGFLATLTGLQMFNSLHLRFHDPKDTWFQKTWFFLFLKEHHRLHHGDTSKNFNVYFFPLADWLLGTFMKEEKAK